MKEKSIEWIGSSKKDLVSLPEDVVDEIGYALYLAQIGKHYKGTKVLKGFAGALYNKKYARGK